VRVTDVMAFRQPPGPCPPQTIASIPNVLPNGPVSVPLPPAPILTRAARLAAAATRRPRGGRGIPPATRAGTGTAGRRRLRRGTVPCRLSTSCHGHEGQELVRHVRLAAPVVVEPGDRAVHVVRFYGAERNPHHARDEDDAAVVVPVKLADVPRCRDSPQRGQTARQTKRGYTYVPMTAR
jgi:hypothetical protein